MTRHIGVLGFEGVEELDAVGPLEIRRAARASGHLAPLGARPARGSRTRYVDAGTVIPSAGVSAGIDPALHLVAAGLGRAREVARYVEFEYGEHGSTSG